MEKWIIHQAFVGVVLCNPSSKFISIIVTNMDTRKMDTIPDQSLKENVSHATSMVTNLLSENQINGIQIISTMEPNKEHLLVGTTIHGEDVIYIKNMVTLE